MRLDENIQKIRQQSNNIEREAIDHTSDILNKAESLYEENKKLLDIIDNNKKQWEGEKKSLSKTIKEIERDNHQLMEKVIKSVKGIMLLSKINLLMIK